MDRHRQSLARGILLILVSATHLTTSFADLTQPPSRPTGEQSALEGELTTAVRITATQPTPDLIALIERVVSTNDPGCVPSSDFCRTEYPYQNDQILISDGMPFYPYYALKDGVGNVIHPMGLGRFLKKNAPGTKAGELVDAALEIAHSLPNGGLAWYYPRHFRVNRMLGENLKYSSISQGTIIAGFTEMANANGNIGYDIARKVFLAMLWPFEMGGVNLSDKALLEMPAFAGPPEIILNGWIDALLHIRDYAEATGDAEAADLFKSNMSFLAEIIENFDSREAGLSRYSDLSPYRARVTLASSSDIDTLKVLYRPRYAGLPTLLVPLSRTADPGNFSIYENQILRTNGRIAFVWVSCSQLYDTVLLAESREMIVELNRGSVGRRQTTPGFDGEKLQFNGTPEGRYQYVTFGVDDGLIGGYPTNFLKGGTHNYYHVYHVVGLMLLSQTPECDPKIAHILLEWAFRWMNDIHQLADEEDLQFHGLQNMLDDINANRALNPFTDFDELLAAAEEDRSRANSDRPDS